MNLKIPLIVLALAAATAAVPTASAADVQCIGTPQGLCPDIHEPCVGEGGIDVCVVQDPVLGTCAIAALGTQFVAACVDRSPLAVVVCTSVYVTGVGSCPTDLL